jgi:glycosyltransferase involved in cell wall biosynthesis
MRVLLVHNRYQHAGGEDAVVENERELLRSRGHQVETLEADNDSITTPLAKIMAAGSAVYSADSRNKTRALIQNFRPDVVHAHNLFPVLSPSVYYACHSAGVPVVQTLHNYRLICPGALLMRDGHVCEECVGKTFASPSVWHGCYKQSRAGSFVAAGSAFIHRSMGTYTDRVQRYIALTEFARDKFIEGGLPADSIDVKPNFIDPDPGAGDGNGGFALFVGRLSEEKGIRVLLEAWRQPTHNLPLRIIGSGPLEQLCSEAASENRLIQYLGPKTKPEVLQQLGQATVMVFPSIWYEGFPMVIVEAFSRGTPVLSSKLGSMAEIVQHGSNGLHFAAGDPGSLDEQMTWVSNHSQGLHAMRAAARRDFAAKYSAGKNYDQLLDIYQKAMNSCECAPA